MIFQNSSLKGITEGYLLSRFLQAAILKRPHYPMLTVEEFANRLSGAKSFMSLDACSGYWQLPVDDESS